MINNYRGKDCPDLVSPVVSTRDEADFRNLIRHNFANGYGANTIFILGTTGEAYALPFADKTALIDIAVDEVAKHKGTQMRNPISSGYVNRTLELAVGVTGKDIGESVELAKYARNQGADYTVFMPISINRNKNGNFTRRGVTDLVYKILGESVGTDLIVYNNPGLTGGKSIRTATWKKLAEHPRVKAIKTSANDQDGTVIYPSERVERYQRGAHGNAKVLVGDEVLGLDMMMQHSVVLDGIVAGSANVLPVAWSAAVRKSNLDLEEHYSGEHKRRIDAYKLKAFQREYAENPIGAFKYMLKELGVISSDGMFDPRLAPSDDLKRTLDALMQSEDFQEMFSWSDEAQSRP